MKAVLLLEDGEVFEGVGFGHQKEAFGEAVFNTGMTGYQEVLTDPSYSGQIVAMTYPHIGNYGVNSIDVESSRPQVSAFVTRDLPPLWSSWRGTGSLGDYLESAGIPGITEVDTRRLTRHLRDRGAMRAGVAFGSVDRGELREKILASPSMIGRDLVLDVTCPTPYEWPAEHPRYRVGAFDFGIKLNILRLLASHGCSTTVYPATTPVAQVLSDGVDGVFLSNGPGDPEAVSYGVQAVKDLLGKVPLFGICLGHQLIGRAIGMDTYKLKFGHRGSNHPVMRLRDSAVEITTQNHGFAVDPEPFGLRSPGRPGVRLPEGLVADTDFGKCELTHVNLNDYTVEGFRLVDEPVLAIQYHPEAGPGPHDARYLFGDFISMMEKG